MSAKKGIIQRLNEGVVIGDGGFVFCLERRGYVKAGPWTPEAAIENPEAVRQLHREFLRAGSDVMQAFTFYASDDKLENRGNVAQKQHSGAAINKAACDLAHEVASEGNALVAGGICQTPTYLSGMSKEDCQAIFKKQIDVFVKEKVDFLICEYFEHVEEAIWACEVAKATGLPVAVTLCIGPEGDMHGIPCGETGVKLAKAGADIIGVNCHFDPNTCLDAVGLMKESVEAAGLKAHYMVQPLAVHTPDASKQGFIDLPEFPFALEPRICTRFDIQAYARRAYDMGIRFIGGCCFFEPYHIRAIAEELEDVHGGLPEGSKKHIMWGGGLKMHTKPWVRARANREYWENLKPASGRPFNASMSKSDRWNVTRGDETLVQHAESTTDAELKALAEKKKTIKS